MADGGWFEDVEEAEEEQRDGGVLPVGGDGDEGDELAGDLVDDDVAGVFAAGFVGYDRGGGDADQRGDDGGYGRTDCEDNWGWVQDVGGGVPEQNGGDAAVGAGAGFEQACTEEGGDEPGPEGLFLEGGWI